MWTQIRNAHPNVALHAWNGSEAKKRNKYLDMAQFWEYLLILDSDEYITHYDPSIFEKCVKKLDYGLHLVKFMRNGKETQYGRLLVHPSEWRYKTHKIITNGKEIRPVSQTDSLIEGLEITHDDTNRPQTLKDKIEKYQKWLWKNESKD